MPAVAVVIPSHNGSVQLSALLPKLCAVLAALGESEVVVVDDGSSPTEAARLRELAEGHDGVRLARLEERSGQIHATLRGVSIAEGEIIVTMDDDGSHPSEVIPRMVGLLEKDADLQLVYAAPREPSGGKGCRRPLVRRVGTALNNLLFHRFLGLPPDVPVSSFRAIRRDLVVCALSRPGRYPYLSAMLLSLDPKVAGLRYVPEPKEERQGPSRYGFWRLLSVWVSLLLFWGPLEPVGRLLRRPRWVGTEPACSARRLR